MTGIRTLEDIRQRCVIDDIAGCWLWSGALANTTPCMRVPGIGRSTGAGVALCFILTGKTPKAGEVWHRTAACSSCLCVSPFHRVKGTRKTQMAAFAGIPKAPLHKARIAATRRAQSSVSEAAVIDIRSSAATAKSLAQKHAMSVTHACRIRRNETRLPLGLSAFSQWAA